MTINLKETKETKKLIARIKRLPIYHSWNEGRNGEYQKLVVLDDVLNLVTDAGAAHGKK